MMRVIGKCSYSLKAVMVGFVCMLLPLIATANAPSTNCVQCHSEQVASWQQSHHAQAMAVATKDKVLGDFDDVKVVHGDNIARFFQQDNRYLIEYNEGQGSTLFEVKYTFGFYPLQQYLIATGDGKYQVFPLAWDSRPIRDGGQRWYPVIPDAEVTAEPRLHWQMPLQNWNGMCADCHSDGLVRNYHAASDSFATKWDNINVGCQSCHGDMIAHHEQVDAKSLQQVNPFKDIAKWVLSEGETIASLRNSKGEPVTASEKRQRQAFMDTCFACHSLRAPLTDGFTHDTAFLDQFTPTLLSSPFYHPDGQISEEVYVYGSFVQSKMFKAGVTCLDCHDAHTMQVKTQTNGLCLQCHSAQEYQQPSHIRHDLNSDAGQCITCHMPASTYMGVDARRDHSFKVPRPSLSTQHNTPNVCIDCHDAKSNQWAAAQVSKWFGKSNALSNSAKQLVNLLDGREISFEQHVAIVNDTALSDIERASALALLPNTVGQVDDALIRPWVESDVALLRLASAQIGFLVPPSERQKTYLSLLEDKYKAIRVAAAEHVIAPTQPPAMEPSLRLQRAFNELTLSKSLSSWRGEGALNLSQSQFKQGNLDLAVTSLEHSIKIDPYFAPAYINLLDIYRQINAHKKEQVLFEQGLVRFPQYAPMQYAYGLYMIRQKELGNAVSAFEKAVVLAPNEPQYLYLLVLAMDANGDTNNGLKKLKSRPSALHDRQLVELGLSLSEKIGDRQSYEFFRRLL